MIDEHSQQDAVAFVTESLTDRARMRFERRLSEEPDLARYVDDLQEAYAHLALLVPPASPSPELREKVLRNACSPPPSRALAEAGADTPFAFWKIAFPWAMAGVAVILATIFWIQSGTIRHREIVAVRAGADAVALRLEAERARAALAEDLEAVRRELSAAQKKTKAVGEQLRQTRRELVEASEKVELAQLRIATLTSKSNPRYFASVAWDPGSQLGLLRVSRLPANAPQTTYQLWIIDAKTGKPASAGVFQLDAETSKNFSFHPGTPISTAAAFAISLEKRGGTRAPGPEGPVILVSDDAG